MTTLILSIILPGPRNPDGTEGKPFYDNGSGEPSGEAIANFVRWCMKLHGEWLMQGLLDKALPHLRVTTEGFVCPGCNGAGEYESNCSCWGSSPNYECGHCGNSGIAGGGKCPCCNGEGIHDTESEASYHEQGSACCAPEPETRREDY